MIDLAPEHLETVRRILAAHVPECEIRAFGSRVAGPPKPYSDLDLAVKGECAVAPDCLRRLREAFEESALPIRVDVLDWYAVTATFRTVLEKQYEIIRSGDAAGAAAKPQSQSLPLRATSASKATQMER